MRILEKDRFECDFLLASNGAVIMNPGGGILAESRCDGSLAKPLLEFMMSIGCNWADIHTVFSCTIDERDKERFEDKFTIQTMPEIPYFNQISTILPTVEEAARVTAEIKNKFGEYLNPLQNSRCIDIVSVDTNKAQVPYNLLKIVDAEYDDMITVGDNINDTHMIAEFRSYAMENAVQSIKDIADYITESVTELIKKEPQ